MITRQAALFFGKLPPNIGPIRRGRSPDWLSCTIRRSVSPVRASVSLTAGTGQFRSAWIRSWYPGYYRTGADKPFEHTFCADRRLLRAF